MDPLSHLTELKYSSNSVDIGTCVMHLRKSHISYNSAKVNDLIPTAKQQGQEQQHLFTKFQTSQIFSSRPHPSIVSLTSL